MEIGTEKPAIVIEPVEEPIRRERPDEPVVAPEPLPEVAPELVPA